MIRHRNVLLFFILSFVGYASAYANQYSLAIKGGVSLGNYEAGLNWVLLEELRKRTRKLQRDSGEISNKYYSDRYLTIAGASAGSINALVASLRFCTQNTTETSYDNLFKNTWDISVETLAPTLGDKEGSKVDYNDIFKNFEYVLINNETNIDTDRGGVLSRTGILKSARKLYAEMTNNRDGYYIEGCVVRLAVAVTSVTPESKNIGGIDVMNQRFIIPLQMKIEHGKPTFTNLFDNEAEFVKSDSYIYLPTDKGCGDGGQVPPLDVLRAILASSAFPIAFAPVPLNYCTIEKVKYDSSDVEQSVYFKNKSGLFIDGSGFDSAPIGAAYRISRYKNKLCAGPNVSVGSNALADAICIFGFVNPSKRRERDPTSRTAQSSAGARDSYSIFSLLNYGDLFVDFASTGMSAELYRAAREIDSTHGERSKMFITSRYYPVTGDFLARFGAFIDKQFRDYDYYVGIYDGLVNVVKLRIASEKGKRCGVEGDARYYDCIGDLFLKMLGELNIYQPGGPIHDQNIAMFTVIKMIASREFAEYKERESWQWLYYSEDIDTKPLDTSMIDIYWALDGTNCKRDITCGLLINPNSFETFLTRLSETDNIDQYSPFTQAILRDPDQATFSILNEVMDRVASIEHKKLDEIPSSDDARKTTQKNIIGALNIAGFIGKSYLDYYSTGLWPRTTASTSSKTRWLIPDEVGFDLLRPSTGFRYSLFVRQLAKHWSLDGTLNPITIVRRDYNYLGIDLDIRYHAFRMSGIVSSFGAGLGVVYVLPENSFRVGQWRERWNNPVVSNTLGLSIGFAGDKLRLIYSANIDPVEIFDQVKSLDRPRLQEAHSISILITDVKGILSRL